MADKCLFWGLLSQINIIYYYLLQASSWRMKENVEEAHQKIHRFHFSNPTPCIPSPFIINFQESFQSPLLIPIPQLFGTPEKQKDVHINLSSNSGVGVFSEF